MYIKLDNVSSSNKLSKGDFRVSAYVIEQVLKWRLDTVVENEILNHDERVFIASDGNIYVTIKLFIDKNASEVNFLEQPLITFTKKFFKENFNSKATNIAIAYVKIED